MVFVVSLFSTLFLIGGYAETTLFYNSFHINAANYFELSDYLSRSVAVISGAAIATLLAIIFFLMGLMEAFTESVGAEQFDEEAHDNSKHGVILLGLFTVLLVLHSIKAGMLVTEYLYPLVFFISLYLFHRLPVWNYIQNRRAVAAVALATIVFGINLGFRSWDAISNARDPNVAAPYLIEFKEGYSMFSSHKVLDLNSRYVFLLQPDHETVSIVPMSAVKSIHGNTRG